MTTLWEKLLKIGAKVLRHTPKLREPRFAMMRRSGRLGGDPQEHFSAIWKTLGV